MITIETKTGAIIRIFLYFTVFSMFILSFHCGHNHVTLPNFHEYFLFQYRLNLTQVENVTKVWPSSFLYFLMSKHVKFCEFSKNRENCSSLGFYIYHTHLHFLKEMSFLHTRGIKQIVQIKNIEDDITSIFTSGTGPISMLTVPSPL